MEKSQGLYTNLVPVPKSYTDITARFVDVTDQDNAFFLYGGLFQTYSTDSGRYTYDEDTGTY